MITSFNFYYAQPGHEDAVLRQRLRASDVRETLEIPRGRVMRRTEGSASLPDVIWDLQFAEVAGHHSDMAVRAASPEFEAVRAGMRTLLRRFERPLFAICADTVASSPNAAAVVTLDWVFCGAEHAETVLDAFQRRVAGSGPGRLFRLTTPGPDLPEFLWQQEFHDADGAARRRAFMHGSSGPYRTEASAWEVA
ncbi:MAG: hypothetical protein ACK5TE_12730 [Pseudomonadota bacterium]